MSHVSLKLTFHTVTARMSLSDDLDQGHAWGHWRDLSRHQTKGALWVFSFSIS